MRTTFRKTADGELVSAIRSRGEAHDLTVGMPVLFTRPYATQYGVIPSGAKGFIDYVDDSGLVEVLMEGIEPALVHWNNTLVLVPFTCEDLSVCLRLPQRTNAPVTLSIEGAHK